MKTLLIVLMVFLMSCIQTSNNKVIQEKPKYILVIHYINGENESMVVPDRTCGFMEDASKIILNERSCVGYYCLMTTHSQRDAYFVSIACNVKKFEIVKDEF
jgi:hypothetical protein